MRPGFALPEFIVPRSLTPHLQMSVVSHAVRAFASDGLRFSETQPRALVRSPDCSQTPSVRCHLILHPQCMHPTAVTSVSHHTVSLASTVPSICNTSLSTWVPLLASFMFASLFTGAESKPQVYVAPPQPLTAGDDDICLYTRPDVTPSCHALLLTPFLLANMPYIAAWLHMAAAF